MVKNLGALFTASQIFLADLLGSERTPEHQEAGTADPLPLVP